MNNFDLRKFLTENKLTSNSRINEGLDTSSAETFLRSVNIDPSKTTTTSELGILIRAWVEEVLKELTGKTSHDVIFYQDLAEGDSYHHEVLENLAEEISSNFGEDYLSEVLTDNPTLKEAMDAVFEEDLHIEDDISYMFEKEALQQAKEGGFEPLGSINLFTDLAHYPIWEAIPPKEWSEEHNR
jgi:hypothetical protein